MASPQSIEQQYESASAASLDGHLDNSTMFVEGRDSNAILRELMHTDDSDQVGVQALL